MYGVHNRLEIWIHILYNTWARLILSYYYFETFAVGSNLIQKWNIKYAQHITGMSWLARVNLSHKLTWYSCRQCFVYYLQLRATSKTLPPVGRFGSSPSQRPRIIHNSNTRSTYAITWTPMSIIRLQRSWRTLRGTDCRLAWVLCENVQSRSL